MDIRFRQGVIASPANSFQKNDSGGIDIVINGPPILATIASGYTNYTISETRSVANAWGPFTGNATVYLYWQIDSRSGDVLRKSTQRHPIVTAVEPIQLIDTLWFDMNVSKMKRFNGTTWETILAVFAATLSSGVILIPQPPGSQVGITASGNDVGFSTGYVLRDGLGNALRTSNAAEFLTSETPILSVDTGSLVKFEGSQLVATAATPLAAFDIVHLSGSSLVNKASGENLASDSTRVPIGMVTVNAVANTQVAVVTAGKKVVNEQWNWDINQIGKSIYCGVDGQATTVKPDGYKHVRVGVICTANSILLTFDWETDVVLPTSGGSSFNLNATAPLVLTGTTNKTLSIPRATDVVNGFMHAEDLARITALEINPPGAIVLPIIVAGSDEITPISTIGERINFRMPKAGILQEVHINISETSSLTTDTDFDVTVNGVSVFVDGIPMTISSGTFNAKKIFADLATTYLQVDDLVAIEITDLGNGNLIGLKVALLVLFGSVASTEALASNELPLSNGGADPGASDSWARGDHVHPTDTSRASLQDVDNQFSALNDRVFDVEESITDAAASLIAVNDRIDNLPASEIKIVSTSRTLIADDDGDVLEITTDGVILTVPEVLPAQFGCAVMVATGTTSVAVTGAVTLNGATTTLTRASATNPMFAIVRRTSSAFAYTVTGN